MKVFCYYQKCSDDPDPSELIAQWRDSFQQHGFLPEVLSEDHARMHPEFSRVEAFANQAPTVNHRGYERACWLRWCAYAMVAPGLATDYDVINFGLRPEEVQQSDMTTLDAHIGPGSCYVTRAGADAFIAQFNDESLIKRVDTCYGRPHMSDMTLFRACFQGKVQPVCWGVGSEEGKTAKLRHFNNGALPAKFQQNNRHLYIAQMRAKSL